MPRAAGSSMELRSVIRAKASRQVPAGDYYVQAVLNIYETFHRADGRTLKLPMDQGEGQHWNRKPGNLYSEPAKVHFDPASGTDCSHRAD